MHGSDAIEHIGESSWTIVLDLHFRICAGATPVFAYIHEILPSNTDRMEGIN